MKLALPGTVYWLGDAQVPAPAWYPVAENSSTVRDMTRSMSFARQIFRPAAGINTDTIVTNRPAARRQADMAAPYSCTDRQLPLGGSKGGQNVHCHHNAKGYPFLLEAADRSCS